MNTELILGSTLAALVLGVFLLPQNNKKKSKKRTRKTEKPEVPVEVPQEKQPEGN